VTDRSGKESPLLVGRISLFQIFLAVLACLVIFAPGARASDTGTISGIVTDPSGAVIPEATVTASNKNTGVKETTTDTRGFYSFPSLPIGEYEIQIQKTGFGGYQQTGLVIDVNSSFSPRRSPRSI